ncbi:calcium-binding protein [Mesorhizobium sp. IMUNJ 23232]|uniref:calcium-binding protein n=1 Tax=Mesorhizobium sp. IMUNJ 23232 TaxID=3376064 RepID=UPI0037A3FEBF
MALTISRTMKVLQSEFTANSYNFGNQLAPDALGLSNGGFVVAYNNNSLSDGAIRLDFYDADQTIIGTSKVPYKGTHTDAVGEPSLTELAGGKVLVVWDDNNETNADNYDPGLKGAIFDSQGNVVKLEFPLTSESVVATGVDVTALSNGNFVISYGKDGATNQISYRLYDANGVALGAASKVNVSDTGTQEGAQITALSNGGFAVAWMADSGDGSPTASLRVYNAAGTPGAPIALSTNCFDLALTGLDNGNIAVVVREDGLSYDFKLKIIAQDGTVLKTANIAGNPTHPATQPDIVQLDSGHIVVTWTHEHSSTDHDIYGSLFDAAGNLLKIDGSATFAITAGTTDDVKSTVTDMVGNGFLTAWQVTDPNGANGSSIEAEINAFVNVVKGDNAADTYTGDSLKDEIEGGGGKDTLSGASGDDFINGGSGNDFLDGGAGSDQIFGGIDNDIIHGAVSNDSSTWMEGDELYGEAGDDFIAGYWGDDFIMGGAGKDTISAAKGDDRIWINKGDVVAGEAIDGGDDEDTLVLNAINVPSTIDISALSLFNVEKIELGGAFGEPTTFVMDAGLFWGQNEEMIIDGHNSQKDTVVINMGATTNANLFLLNMDLSAFPGFEDQVIINGDGDAEKIRGTEWAETINGNGGTDTIHAGNGDKVFGGAGDDTLHDSGGHIKFDGGDDIDTVSYATQGQVKASLDAAFQNNFAAQGDSFAAIENLIGSAKNDWLFGDSGANVLDGGFGDDILYGGDGGDKLIGGDGIDTAHYSGADAGVIASLANPSINSGFAKGDSYVSIENLSGSKYDDALNGDNAINTIRGGVGGDSIKGYGGNDTLVGDAGADKFIFNSALDAAANVDTITDFDAADDTIQLDDAVFTALKSLGVLDASFFRANANGLPADANDYIVYETDTGKLFYDADGNGANFAGVQFATLTGMPTITAADFEVI